jgi:hypothetical protein
VLLTSYCSNLHANVNYCPSEYFVGTLHSWSRQSHGMRVVCVKRELRYCDFGSHNVVTCLSVTLDGFSIDDRIYCSLWYIAWPHLKFTITYTLYVHSYIFTSRCSVAVSNGGYSPSSRFPNCSRPQLPASHTNSPQRLNLSSWLTLSLINQLILTHLLSTVLLIISRKGPHRKHRCSAAV